MAARNYSPKANNVHQTARLKNHPNIILTPPRLSDAPLSVEYFNDARVHGFKGLRSHIFLRTPRLF